MIKFEKLRFKNFLSTGNNFTEIDFVHSSTTLVVGHNGAGKSTMLDALSFGLFGKPHRKISKPQLVNTINNKGTLVEVEFSVGSQNYKIIRGIKPNIFEIWVNGNMINQNSHAKEYQQVLEKNILKLTHKSFHQIVVLGSSSFVPFMQLASGARRDVIEDLLDIGVFSKMNGLLKDLGKDGSISAEKLHNVRSELSAVIFESKGKPAAVNLRPFLTAIDDKLDEIDGYAAARSKFADSSAIDRAVDNGVKIFSGGRISSVSPKQLETMLAQMTDFEREAFKKGARDYIGALMGTSRNDAAAAWGEFAKGWNAEKLKMIIGDDAAKEVTRRLFAEKMFSETRSDVLKGSQTQFRKEGAASLGDIREPDTMNAPSPIARAKAKLFD